MYGRKGKTRYKEKLWERKERERERERKKENRDSVTNEVMLN